MLLAFPRNAQDFQVPSELRFAHNFTSCLVQERSQQLQQPTPQVGELQKELARLKQDGQAYREDLTRQLEAAKQAVTQARHDAAQASSQAAHEASQVKLLQGDKDRMAEIADSWRKQANENQV